MIKLCYKEYPYKMSLGAMKEFKKATGKDLWHTLLSMIEVYIATEESPLITRLRALYETLDFETAAYAFHCLIKQENKSIPLSEIEDSMFRVGWMPTDRDGDASEPWPFVMVKLAYDIDSHFSELGKKKADTKQGSEES